MDSVLDSDDLWIPTKLERQIVFMSANGYAFTYTRYRAIDDSGKELGIEITAPQRLTYCAMVRYDWMDA